MLLVDDRIGSKDLLTPLKNFGVPAESAHLEFGDFAFMGRGLGGKPVSVGVELKRAKDMLNSRFSGRLAGHQLPGLLATYDRVWLVTEAMWRASKQGVLETWQFRKRGPGWYPLTVGNRAFMVRDLHKGILTYTIRGGVHYWHCPTANDTVLFISALYHWWTDKNMDEHKSHLALYQQDLDRSLLIKPSQFRQTVATWPGVGMTRSYAVEKHFGGSISKAVRASESEWAEIEGIGKLTAKKIKEALK